MATRYSEYSELRSIARKRAERLSEAGLSDLITFPSVRELKSKNISVESALKTVKSYLSSPTRTREYRKMDEATRPQFIQTYTGAAVVPKTEVKKERRKAQNRVSAKRYRERVKSLTKQEKSYMKAAKTLGLRITPSQAKAFREYMDFRFAQGGDSVHYKIARYVEDYQQIISKQGYTPGQILSDFNRFLSDRMKLLDSYDNMDGVSGEYMDELFEDYIDE